MRRFAVPAAVPQDLNIFATPVVDLPSPIAMTASAGSYQTSCVNASQRQMLRVGSPWTMTILSADCRSGGWPFVQSRPASLNDPQTCTGDITNTDGVLQCQRAVPTVLGRPLFVLPGGSWHQTCRDAYYHVQSREIRAQCRTVSGAWRHTSLSTAYPCTSVSNDDGWLSCDTAALPRGPWRAQCKEASIPLPGVGFGAICQRASDGVWQRTTVASCSKEVDALDGHLTCGLITGLPAGTWRERCRPINWDAAEPAITLVCRNNDQTQAAYRVTMSGCGSPLSLFYDGTGTKGFLC